MFIERLTLKNFKSFGGSHELAFARGFTAIVGPNGSGKSNILDGLRWVLGEGNAARLRINRQSDLIFQGSAGLSQAEETDVALALADEDRRGALRRHLDSSGSALFVEGQRVRLQDLIHFKQNWHLEGDKSAFIGQGEVTGAIVQRPFQRRLQLEELFGIDQYRRRRDDAQGELKQAGDEMARLQTLTAELEARRREIAPDLEKALKAQELENRLLALRSALYHHRRFAEEARQEDLAERAKATAAFSVRLQRWAELWDRALRALREGGSDYAQKRGALQECLEELTPSLDHARQREMELEAERRQREFALGRLEEEQSRRAKDLEDQERLRTQAAQETAALDREVGALLQQQQDLDSRQAAQVQRSQELRRRRQELIEQEAKAQEEAHQMRARAEALGLQGSQLIQRLEELRRRKEEIISRQTDEDQKLEEAEERLESLSEAQAQRAALSQELAIRLQGLRRSIVRDEAELDSLIQSAEGGLYPRPVQMVLSAVKLGRLAIETLPALEAFSCPHELALALEAYLGGRQFWLLVDSMEQARTAIELLKERKGGRATFLPLERCRRLHSAPLPKGQGILGWAAQLVTALPRWSPAVDHLLGDLLVVQDYGTGAKLVASGARYPVVTLEGEVFSPGGTVSGGQSAKSGGAITMRRRIADLEERLKLDRSAQEEVRGRLAEAEAAEAKAHQAQERAQQALEVQRKRSEDLRRELKDCQGELAELTQQREASDVRIGQYGDAEKQALQRASEARKEIDSLAQTMAGEAGHSGGEELRTRLLLQQERFRGAKSDLERLVHSVADLRRAVIAGGQEQAKEKEALRLCQESLTGVQERRRSLEEAKAATERDMAELDRKNSHRALRMERQISRTQRAQAAMERARRDELTARQDLEKSRGRLEEMIAAFEGSFPYPGDFKPSGESLERIEGSCRYVERALRELGPVNSGAISEDQSLEERLGFLKEQIADVRRGLEELEEMIRQADNQAGLLFNDALSRIDRRFDDLFQKLFGGGEAHLKIQEGQSLWEAGVEIIARPPGKKTLYLAQLSGGEQSLTALALLFASMEVAQVPLAVLDEVDAALDEVNLLRFAQMVTDYANRLQLVVMTHRRQTMERAEVMYGVTMSEPGLSQIIGVKLEQWT